MKQNSIVVSVGQKVLAGQKLGVVGSSGCSTWPHVHLEVHDCNKNVVDPMKLGMIAAAPVYSRQAPTTLMSNSLHQPVITSVAQMEDPGADSASVANGQQFSLGVYVANLKPGDSLVIKTFDPSGVQQPLGGSISTAVYYPLSVWWINTTFSTSGVWTVNYVINGTKVGSRSVSVQ